MVVPSGHFLVDLFVFYCALGDTNAKPYTSAPDPDTDPDPAVCEVGSGKYWPDPHNYDIKHHNIFFIPGNDT